MRDINILHEDQHSIIINKPAGLAVQGGKGINFSLDDYFKNFGAVLIHRLDRDTSGVLLAAKENDAARFSKIFGAQRKAEKIYTAVCADRPENDKGVINDDLLVHGAVKKSETKYKLMKTGKLSGIDFEYSVLELELGTGRMHQIRRHLAMINCPVLGDDKYGNFQLNKNLRKSIGLKKMLLHASRLIIKEFNIDITAPFPAYFNLFLS